MKRYSCLQRRVLLEFCARKPVGRTRVRKCSHASSSGRVKIGRRPQRGVRVFDGTPTNPCSAGRCSVVVPHDRVVHSPVTRSKVEKGAGAVADHVGSEQRRFSTRARKSSNAKCNRPALINVSTSVTS